MTPRLILINGPIASGKSTLAYSLGRLLRERGCTVAVVELDLLYQMLDHGRPMDNPAIWQQARRASAALANHLFATGTTVVILEGDFWSAGGRSAVLDHLSADVQVTGITLTVAFDQALRRVQHDRTRSSSRDPALLRRNQHDFHAALAEQPSADLLLSTDEMPPESITRSVLSHLGLVPG